MLEFNFLKLNGIASYFYIIKVSVVNLFLRYFYVDKYLYLFLINPESGKSIMQ